MFDSAHAAANFVADYQVVVQRGDTRMACSETAHAFIVE